MNKRQIKKFLRKPLPWRRIDDRLSYLALSRRHNNKHVQKALRKMWGANMWYYPISFPEPIRGLNLTYGELPPMDVILPT